MKKIIILLSTMLFVIGNLIAQDQQRGEFSLNLGGGISTLYNSLSSGEYKMGYGGSAGLGYTYFLNTRFGIGTGVDFSIYQAQVKLAAVSEKYMSNDGVDPFEYRSTINNYKENQNALFVNIPLMFQYQSEGRYRFYAALGGRIGIPVNSTYKNTAATINTSAYYEQWDVVLNGPEFRGLGTFTDQTGKGDLNLKTSFMLSAETGLKWPVSDNLSFYTGVYVDYGVNNLGGAQDKEFLAYDASNPSDLHINSIVVSKVSQDQQISTFSNKISPLSLGLKIRLSFGMGGTTASNSKKNPWYVNYENTSNKEEKPVVVETQEDTSTVKQEPEKPENSAYSDAVRIIEERISGYEIDVVNFTAKMKLPLDNKIRLLKSYPKLKLVITGHTSDEGSDEKNEKLGLQRANAVKMYMISQGIDEERITTASKGESEPLAPNLTKASQLKNDRVEFKIREQ